MRGTRAQCNSCTNELEKEGIATVVMNLATIKPLDKNEIVGLAKECRENSHSRKNIKLPRYGSAVAEVLAVEYPNQDGVIRVKDEFETIRVHPLNL